MFRRTVSLSSAAAVIALGIAVPEARASIFSSSELSYDNALLSQFNLVTLNTPTTVGGAPTTANLASVGGRAIIGGNATFSGTPNVCTGNCNANAVTSIDSSGAKFGALTVFGNLVTPGSSSNYTALNVGGGDVSVRGTSSGNVVMNNGSGATGNFRISGSAQNSTNIANATGIKTTQSTFAGGSYTYNTSFGLVTGNGTTPQVSQTIASVFPFGTAYQTQVKTLATGIASLPGTRGVSAQTLTVGTNVFFTANNDYSYAGKNYGVITTTVADLAAQTSFKGINNNGNDATLVIVRGDGANYTLPTLGSYANSNRVIFDFVDATTLKFGGAWAGSILAPLATITMGSTFDGSVIVNNITQSQALYSNNLFNGDLTGLIPEPASLALLGAGIVAAGLIRRHRRK